MIGSPHERAGHVLGVDQAIIVGRLDGHDGRLGCDAVDANVVVVGGDDARHVRAVVELVAPAVKVLRRHAVHRTLYGALRVHAARQVGVDVLHTGVDDGDGHGRALHVNLTGLARVHGLRTPVEDLFGGRLRGGLITHGGQAGARRVCGCLSGSVPGLVSGQCNALVVEHALGAGRADRVDGNSGVLQLGGQIGGERGRGALGEEGADLRVRGQGRALGSRDQGDRALQVGGACTGGQVDRVVHLVVVGANRGDEAGRVLGVCGRSNHRRDAHGQGERGDDSDACGSAAHCSSTFDCYSVEHDCVG